jgi:hypothetical protein
VNTERGDSRVLARKSVAVALAAPGGLLSIAWTIMIAVTLLKPPLAAL